MREIRCARCYESRYYSKAEFMDITIHPDGVWVDPVCEGHMSVCCICERSVEMLFVCDIGCHSSLICRSCYQALGWGQSYHHAGEFKGRAERMIWLRDKFRQGGLTSNVIGGIMHWNHEFGDQERLPGQVKGNCRVCGVEGVHLIAVVGHGSVREEWACEAHIPTCFECRAETKDLFMSRFCGKPVCEKCLKKKLEHILQSAILLRDAWDKVEKVYLRYLHKEIPAYGDGMVYWYEGEAPTEDDDGEKEEDNSEA